MRKTKVGYDPAVGASLSASLVSSAVTPAAWWERPPWASEHYTVVPRQETHDKHYHGVLQDSGADWCIVDCVRGGAEFSVLPFSNDLWLFCSRERPAAAILPGFARTVKLSLLQSYAMSTRAYAAWIKSPKRCQPWCALPSTDTLAEFVKQQQQKQKQKQK